MPFKIWAIGEEVLAADFNDYVQEQVVATFPNAAARAAAIASPVKGMLTWRDDANVYEYWSGAAWLTATGAQNMRIRGGSFVGTSNGAGAIGIPVNPPIGSSVVTVQAMMGDNLPAFIVALNYAFVASGSGEIPCFLLNPATGAPYPSITVRIEWLLIDVP